MSELLVNTIKKADGTGSLTVPAESGTVVTTASPSLGRRNLIINGGQVIDQRNGGALVSSANGYITDRWTCAKFDPAGGAYSAQQVTDAPDGFSNSLKMTVTTNLASQSADAYWQVFQKIEGYNASHLGFGTASAKTVTVSFWVKSSVAGDYSFALFNDGEGGTNRAYTTTYTVNSTNTWEYKTITIAGDGTSGAGFWGTSNANGVSVYFDLGSGSNQEITADTWTSANARRVAGTVRLMATSGATWQITGVQLEVGSVATPFEHRSYGEELALCQRYFYAMNATTTNNGYPFLLATAYWTNQCNAQISLPVTMRALPTLGFGNSFRFYRNATYEAFTTMSNDSSSALTINMAGTGLSHTAGTSGNIQIRTPDGGFIQADAEL